MDRVSNKLFHKRNTMQKIITLSLSFLVALTMFSCSQKTNTETVRYLFWDRNFEPAVKEMKAEFEKENPNILVTIEIVPWANYWQKLEAATIGEKLPMCFG